MRITKCIGTILANLTVHWILAHCYCDINYEDVTKNPVLSKDCRSMEVESSWINQKIRIGTTIQLTLTIIRSLAKAS